MSSLIFSNHLFFQNFVRKFIDIYQISTIRTFSLSASFCSSWEKSNKFFPIRFPIKIIWILNDLRVHQTLSDWNQTLQSSIWYQKGKKSAWCWSNKQGHTQWFKSSRIKIFKDLFIFFLLLLFTQIFTTVNSMKIACSHRYNIEWELKPYIKIIHKSTQSMRFWGFWNFLHLLHRIHVRNVYYNFLRNLHKNLKNRVINPTQVSDEIIICSTNWNKNVTFRHNS